MDLADDYPSVKIIAIGAVDTARQVVQYDSEMQHRVSEVLVPLMTESEIREIIKKGAELLNLNFTPEVEENIIIHSAGMASVCHDLCLHLCTEAGIFETSDEKITFTREDWKRALLGYLAASSDKIQSAFEKALKQRKVSPFHHAKIIIECLCDFRQGKASRIELENKIKRIYEKYPKTGMKSRLDGLCSQEKGAILKYDENSGAYAFSDPIYHAYAMAHRKAILESKDNASIPPEHEAFLKAIGELLKNPNIKIRLEGPAQSREVTGHSPQRSLS